MGSDIAKPEAVGGPTFAPALADLFSTMGITTDAEGNVLCTVFGCPTAHSQQAPCQGCRRHDQRDLWMPLGVMFGMPLRLRIKFVRLRCPDRKQWRAEWPPAINASLRLPVASVYAALMDTCNRSNADVAARHGIPRKKIGTIVASFEHALMRAFQPTFPEDCHYAAADVVRLAGQLTLVVAAVTEKGIPGSRLITVLPFQRSDRAAMITALRHVEGWERIKAVAHDLKSDEIGVFKAAWPQVAIVADEWHVNQIAVRQLRRARNALDRRRRQFHSGAQSGQAREPGKRLLESRPHGLSAQQRKQLEVLLGRLGPVVADLYAFKEKLADLYKIREPAVAEQAFDDLIASVTARRPAWSYLKPVATELRKWRREILAFFQHPIRTVFVEGSNARFKPRFRLLSVSGGQKRHHLRTLIAEGALDREVVERTAWTIASTFGTGGKNE